MRTAGNPVLGAGFVTAWGRLHVDLCRLTGSICLG
ncbi:putative leader peptide [Rhodococcus sp. G-MC3]